MPYLSQLALSVSVASLSVAAKLICDRYRFKPPQGIIPLKDIVYYDDEHMLVAFDQNEITGVIAIHKKLADNVIFERYFCQYDHCDVEISRSTQYILDSNPFKSYDHEYASVFKPADDIIDELFDKYQIEPQLTNGIYQYTYYNVTKHPLYAIGTKNNEKLNVSMIGITPTTMIRAYTNAKYRTLDTGIYASLFVTATGIAASALICNYT